jgi:hypothetical protein
MNPNEQTEFLSQALAQAPAYIQSFIQSGKYETFLEKVKAISTFNTDVQVKISNEILIMLLGMSEPKELIDNLKREAGITDIQAEAVVVLANDEIFTPLQQEIQASTTATKIITTSAAQASPLPSPPLVPILSLTTPASEPLLTAPKVSASIATPLPQQPLPTGNVSSNEPSWTPTPEIQSVPTMRTMAHDVESMKEGIRPAPTPYSMPNMPERSVPPQQTQTPVPVVPISLPSTQTPVPEPVPVRIWAPVSVPPSQIPTAPETSRIPSPDPTELTNTLKKYGIDPYREPPE